MLAPAPRSSARPSVFLIPPSAIAISVYVNARPYLIDCVTMRLMGPTRLPAPTRRNQTRDTIYDQKRTTPPCRTTAASRLTTVSLDDKYTATSGGIFLTGIQALVRLPLVQRRRDLAAGLNTAGFISGYRGSPLGGLDEALWKAQNASRCAPRQVPAWRQRGTGGHRRLGHAAGAPARRRQVRRRLRHVVRQGPRRRPLRRCVQAHELRRHGSTWRRAAGRRRRPRRLFVDAAAPERPPVLGFA